MKEQIEKVTREIIGKDSSGIVEVSELTKCAVDIGTIALTTLNGELRNRAINIAMSIVDYEDELKNLA